MNDYEPKESPSEKDKESLGPVIAYFALVIGSISMCVYMAMHRILPSIPFPVI